MTAMIFLTLTQSVSGKGNSILVLLIIIVIIGFFALLPVLFRPPRKKGAPDMSKDEKAVQRRIDELSSRWEAVSRVFTSLTSIPDAERLFEIIPSTVRNIMKAKYAALFLKDEEKEHEFNLKSYDGITVETAKALKIDESLPFVKFMLKSSHPINIGQNDRDFKFFTRFKEKFKHVLLYPMYVKEKMIGFLLISDREDGQKFDRNDLEIMNIIVKPVGYALENAYQYDYIGKLAVGQIVSMANSLEKRDEYTRGHSDRVAQYCMLMTRAMMLTKDQAESLEIAAKLHDVGKIGIPDAVLLKPGRLTDEEFDVIKEHPTHSADIMTPLSILFKKEIPIVLHHHERYDGTGYPGGLKKDNIPLGARILALADTYDAMTSNRPYRKAFEPEEALKKMAECGHTQFDPELLNIFLQTMKKYLAYKEKYPEDQIPM